ncbi:MAG: DNA-directed RNA polymerase subunit omega [Acidaminococcaceae bacterium]|nr:DNA-directed RNA polymerase subunit omega [Acidaminococcaceae bacterium]
MSIISPSIDKLATMADSRYTLVIMAAKRAREITYENFGCNMLEKEVSAAFKEIMGNKITYRRDKE